MPLFAILLSFQQCVHYEILPMTGFEPWTSGIQSNRSANEVTTTARATSTAKISTYFA